MIVDIEGHIMADSIRSFFSNIVGIETREDREEEVRAFKKYDELAASLLATTMSAGELFVKHQDFWDIPHLISTTLAIQGTFKARTTDIILATFPKSGTTWIKALIFCIMNRTRYSFDHHPLLTYSPHDCVPFLHSLYEDKSVPSAFLDSMPSPRLFGTHIPFSCLPMSVTESGCRIIYQCRDPKDILVSMMHYVERIYNKTFPIEDACQMMCMGELYCGPIWDHILEYWRESLKRPAQVMFLTYEDLMDDTVRNLKRLADFLGRPFDEEKEKGVAEEIVQFCGIDRMRNLEVNKSGEHGVARKFKNSAFFRNGKVGEWKQHISMEMAQKIDDIMEQKFQGSGLTLGKKC